MKAKPEARIQINPENRSQSRLRRFFDIHLVDYCQLNCKHCYLTKRSNTMPLSMFKRICEDFLSIQHPIKDIDIVLSGGEPLLHPEFPKIVEHLRSIMQPVRLSSNGLLIPKYISLFERQDGDGIQISVDGDQHTHDFIRGEGTYDRAINALYLLYEKSIPHSITFVLCKENSHCIGSLIKVCRQTGTKNLNIVQFNPFANTGLTQVTFDKWINLRERARKEAPDLHIPPICAEYGCIGGILGISVLPDGTYWDCSQNQQVIGKFPTPIHSCLFWDYIRNTRSRDQFKTCKCKCKKWGILL